LMHVVDLSHSAWQEHIRSVMKILGQMPTTPGPILLVFNKLDVVDSDTLALAQDEYPQALFISAASKLGIETLRQRLLQLIDYAAAG
ncbi:MAG: GTPase HflX, partial [Moorea sp. SIO3C2]|nr:GTPase HflX [Moorena sp. SIO3C2]